MSQQHSGHDHHKTNRNVPIPETRTGGDGTSKRNIQRKVSKGTAGVGSHGKKGMWDPTDDGSLAVIKPQPGDPNYVDDEDDNYVLVSDSSMIDPMTNGAETMEMSKLSLTDFKNHLTTIFEEFFLSEDIQEAIRSIEELGCPAYHYEIVKRGINLSLDRKDHERELMSKLLSEAYLTLLDSKEVGKGFQRLFEMIDDIQLDAPAARPLVSSFLARAVVDEILPPSFLRNPEITGLGGDIVKGARSLLSRDHVLSRVERVWGPGDGRSVQELKVAIDQLVEEYLLSRQPEEAIQCIRELNCPHFHHEIIKRAIRQAINRTEDDCTAMSSLLVDIRSQDIISASQIVMGFDKLYETLPDIMLDVPTANLLLEKFVKQAKQDECLPKDYTRPVIAPASHAEATSIVQHE